MKDVQQTNEFDMCRCFSGASHILNDETLCAVTLAMISSLSMDQTLLLHNLFEHHVECF